MRSPSAWYQELIDNAYKVSANLGSPGLFWVNLIVGALALSAGADQVPHHFAGKGDEEQAGQPVGPAAHGR